MVVGAFDGGGSSNESGRAGDWVDMYPKDVSLSLVDTTTTGVSLVFVDGFAISMNRRSSSLSCSSTFDILFDVVPPFSLCSLSFFSFLDLVFFSNIGFVLLSFNGTSSVLSGIVMFISGHSNGGRTGLFVPTPRPLASYCNGS